ncbi:unnamed protein product [Discosporangium mesarthrocarpum]
MYICQSVWVCRHAVCPCSRSSWFSLLGSFFGFHFHKIPLSTSTCSFFFLLLLVTSLAPPPPPPSHLEAYHALCAWLCYCTHHMFNLAFPPSSSRRLHFPVLFCLQGESHNPSFGSTLKHTRDWFRFHCSLPLYVNRISR